MTQAVTREEFDNLVKRVAVLEAREQVRTERDEFWADFYLRRHEILEESLAERGVIHEKAGRSPDAHDAETPAVETAVETSP